MRLFFFMMAGLFLLAGSIFGLNAIVSNIKIVFVAVLFVGALNCLGFGVLLKKE